MTDREQIEAIAELCGWKLCDVEEEVMHWPGGMLPTIVKRWFHGLNPGFKLPLLIGGLEEPPNWLGSLDACKELIEAMRKEGFVCLLDNDYPDGGWSCCFAPSFVKERAANSTESTLERAICRAYLDFHVKWKD